MDSNNLITVINKYISSAAMKWTHLRAKRWPRLIYLLALLGSVCLNVGLFLVKVTQHVGDAQHVSYLKLTGKVAPVSDP